MSEMPGRAPDMSRAAATAMKKALADIEAAQMLMFNAERVVSDITNPGPKNIDGKTLTQSDPVWKQAASFLSGRIQGTPNEMPGRNPDMSSGAAQALRSVLGQM